MTAPERLAAALADHYELERELGQGGMATVYLAHDRRHDRRVAVKVLRPELAAIIGAERFLSEIKTTANLQHPHILPLFDSGRTGGQADGRTDDFLYYVMPFIEGESLRDLLSREKQLPVEEAVRIAREVGSALDYAHRRNIIHRDIKPENILLHDGAALVADFGIALAVSRSDGGTRMTETGMSLGTPYYMSPEQAMGERDLSPRSDVYALGCVLYEMLTGDPPFTGSTAQAVVARVVTESPRPLVPQRHTIPPHVEGAVLTALEKLPADRFATAAEFVEALDGRGPARTLQTRGVAGALALAPWYRRRGTVAAGLTMAALAGLAVWGWLRPGPGRTVSRYGLAFAPGQEPRGVMAFAPDGSRLLYMGATDSTGRQVWVKERPEYHATPIAGTAGGSAPAVSPDGEWFASVQGGQVRKWPIRGGSAITLTTAGANTSPIAWLDDGTLVYVTPDYQLGRVPAAGGEATLAWRRPDSLPQAAALLPAALPGGRGVLFTICTTGCARSDLWVADLRSGEGKRLVSDAARSWYLPTGHLAYSRRDGSVFAAPFDPGRLEITGAPVPVLEGVTMLFEVIANLAFSRSGTLVMQGGGQGGALNPPYELVLLDRRGGLKRVDSAWTFTLARVSDNVGWSVSPDGRRLAIGLSGDAGDDIWIKTLPNGPLSRLTFDSTAEQRPRWTPDGRSVTYISSAGAVLQRSADGTGVTDTLLAMNLLLEGRWTRDGKWLVVRTGGGRLRNILALRPGVDSAPREFLAASQADESAPAVSPDGRWLAYVSDETGRDEVYVRPFPGVDAGKWQVSTAGGQAPLWANSGRELFYVDRDRNMVAVPVPAQGPSQLGARQVLFRLPDGTYLRQAEFYTPFDITPDDRHFVMARRVQAGTPAEASFILVENWFEEVKARMRGR